MLTPSEMKDKMLVLAGKDGYIDSIFNYCDRWCARCPFSSKCRNFSFGKDAPSPEEPEMWEYLHNVFGATVLMLREMMEKMGMDPEEIDKAEPPSKPDPRKHPLFNKTYRAATERHKWLEKKKNQIRSKDEKTNESNKKKNPRLFEAIEVIYQYNFLITSKIARALQVFNYNNDKVIQSDSNGCAKITLVALDRLINSWIILMENNMEYEDDILRILIDLADIRRQTEILFPIARKFVRPGFDN